MEPQLISLIIQWQLYKNLRFAKISLQYPTCRILLYLIIKKMRAVSSVWLAEGILT